MPHASHAYVAGNPFPYDSHVKTWNYWVANLARAGKPGDPVADPEPIAGADKDTTHISIIDKDGKDGNVFDCTPSGGWHRRRGHSRQYRHRQQQVNAPLV
jgi:hypothetical protein